MSARRSGPAVLPSPALETAIGLVFAEPIIIESAGDRWPIDEPVEDTAIDLASPWFDED